MSYFRRSLSDAVTSPSEVDDSIVVGTVPPKRVDCADLPDDSPWRRPGQVCASGPGPLDYLSSVFDKIFSSSPMPPTTDPATSGPAASSSGPSLLLLAAIGGAAYYLYKRK